MASEIFSRLAAISVTFITAQKTTLMLSKEEIDKIIEQEKLRNQIKSSLEKKEKPDNKIVAFFNSALGIFLLSTFFVSFLSWGYTEYSTYRREKSERASRINKLTAEVVNRTQLIKVLMRDSLTRGDTRQLDVLFTGDLDFQLQYGPISNQSYYTSDEFKNKGVLPLLAELKVLKKDPEFDKTINAYQQAQQIAISLQNSILNVISGRGDELSKVHMTPQDEVTFEHEIEPNLLN